MSIRVIYPPSLYVCFVCATQDIHVYTAIARFRSSVKCRNNSVHAHVWAYVDASYEEKKHCSRSWTKTSTAQNLGRRKARLGRKGDWVVPFFVRAPRVVIVFVTTWVVLFFVRGVDMCWFQSPLEVKLKANALCIVVRTFLNYFSFFYHKIKYKFVIYLLQTKKASSTVRYHSLSLSFSFYILRMHLHNYLYTYTLTVHIF